MSITYSLQIGNPFCILNITSDPGNAEKNFLSLVVSQEYLHPTRQAELIATCGRLFSGILMRWSTQVVPGWLHGSAIHPSTREPLLTELFFSATEAREALNRLRMHCLISQECRNQWNSELEQMERNAEVYPSNTQNSSLQPACLHIESDDECRKRRRI